MTSSLHLDIQPQPDDYTCGPTCLHAVYRYFHDHIPLDHVSQQVTRLPNGGTLAVMLANHALRRGYHATIYTYNLQLFDPTWFNPPHTRLVAKLHAQAAAKNNDKLRAASDAYVEYLQLGGIVRFQDLTAALIRNNLLAGLPVLTGLSATYLYRAPREFGPDDDEDDIRGYPAGHFVVLAGYDRNRRTVTIADPLHANPLGLGTNYTVPIERALCAILLGVLTYDANLLVLEPATKPNRSIQRVATHRGR